MTPIRVIPKSVPAPCYNAVRLALLRRGEPLRFPLAGLRRIECILNRQSWRLFDGLEARRRLILEWAGFQTRGRSLHSPVPCELRLYHVHAGLIMGEALDAIELTLGRRSREG